MRIYILILVVSFIFTGCLQSGLQILPAYYTGDASIYNTALVSKIKKGVTKREVERALGPAKTKLKGLDKDHINRYAMRYINKSVNIHEGEYDLWKYYATKNTSEMGIVGSTEYTYRKACIAVFDPDDTVVLFECTR